MTDATPPDAALRAALNEIRERGAIGTTDIDAAISHAEQFASVLPGDVRILADLGSGGGLPGLVIAVRRPELSITLVERRRSRADLLERAVRKLDLTDRVVVYADDVRLLAGTHAAAFDAVTARSFGAPAVTMQWGSTLLRPGGILVVSEPPTDDPRRWPDALLDEWSMHDQGRHQGVRVFCHL
jgi:16S rRNA (guanine527-N7)-methyltransferase